MTETVMLVEILDQLFERDLEKLKDEINAYKNEADLWKTSGEIPNSAGNLCLHLSGNLQHFFGAVLGSTGYVRDRDAEFSSRDVPRSELLAGIEAAKLSVRQTLASLNDKDIEADYPIDVFGKPMTTGFFLTHLSTHFTWHLGQINYHRRFLG